MLLGLGRGTDSRPCQVTSPQPSLGGSGVTASSRVSREAGERGSDLGQGSSPVRLPVSGSQAEAWVCRHSSTLQKFKFWAGPTEENSYPHVATRGSLCKLKSAFLPPLLTTLPVSVTRRLSAWWPARPLSPCTLFYPWLYPGHTCLLRAFASAVPSLDMLFPREPHDSLPSPPRSCLESHLLREAFTDHSSYCNFFIETLVIYHKTISKCTIRCFSIVTRSCNRYHCLNSRTCSSPQKGTLSPTAATPVPLCPLCPLATTSLLSMWICLL